MCGKVFHQISEGIMAQSLKVDVKDARDSASVFVPDVKAGNILAANYVLSHLGIKTNANWSGSYADGNPIWGKAERVGNHSIKLIRRSTWQDDRTRHYRNGSPRRYLQYGEPGHQDPDYR